METKNKKQMEIRRRGSKYRTKVLNKKGNGGGVPEDGGGGLPQRCGTQKGANS